MYNHCCHEKVISFIYLECVFSLSYPACSVHVLYHIVICGLSVCTMFSTLSHKQHDFLRHVIGHKTCMFWFSLQLLCGTFLILRIIQWGGIKNVTNSSVKHPLLSDFNEIWISGQIFKKYSNVKFHENSSIGT